MSHQIRSHLKIGDTLGVTILKDGSIEVVTDDNIVTYILKAKKESEAHPRFSIDDDGIISWGGGGVPASMYLNRETDGIMRFGSELKIEGKLYINDNTNNFTSSISTDVDGKIVFEDVGGVVTLESISSLANSITADPAIGANQIPYGTGANAVVGSDALTFDTTSIEFLRIGSATVGVKLFADGTLNISTPDVQQVFFNAQRESDAQPRITIDTNGTIAFGDGTNAPTLTIGYAIGGILIDASINVNGLTESDGGFLTTSSTDSTDSSTGAIVAPNGGLGIALSAYIGQNLVVAGTTGNGGNTTTGALVVTGGAGIGGNLTSGGVVSILDATESTDNISGALIVAGGIGTSGNINATGDISGFDITCNGAFTLANGGYNATIQVITNITNTTASTNYTDGALVVSGGVGIAGQLSVQGDIDCSTIGASSECTLSKVISGHIDATGIFEHTGSNLGFFGVAYTTQPTALTAPNATVIDSTYGADEEGVLNNVRTRINELESKLQALGLIA